MKLHFDGFGLNETDAPFVPRIATLPDARLGEPDIAEKMRAIARATTACHGLDLPAGVPPGILAEAIDILSAVRAWANAPDAYDIAEIAEEARELLSRLAPVSPETETPAPAR